MVCACRCITSKIPTLGCRWWIWIWMLLWWISFWIYRCLCFGNHEGNTWLSVYYLCWLCCCMLASTISLWKIQRLSFFRSRIWFRQLLCRWWRWFDEPVDGNVAQLWCLPSWSLWLCLLWTMLLQQRI